MSNTQIPKEVVEIIEKLNNASFEAYIVGGCVRDLIMGKEPGDWDITTNAKPEEIQKFFSDSFYENEFGTVGVKSEIGVIEVTTYRLESGYSDKRHPDAVKFAEKLQDDLQRRDFTMNALAMDHESSIIDHFGGRKDIKNKIIRAVGDAEQRFNEDALRMMRAIRFSSTLGFKIEQKTLEEIEAHAHHLKHISAERIRDEFLKLICGDHAAHAIEIARETGILEEVTPELLEGVSITQNLHHIYTVWEHNVRSLQYTAEKNYSPEVRLAALLHDVGKPRAKRGEGHNATFYGHEVVGARMAYDILKRLKFSKEITEKVSKLVRYHMFYYLPDAVTESSVRRLVAKIGKDNVEDLLKLREADRIGSGTPKAIPYKLRHLKFMIDKVARDPISPKLLKINGNDVMELLGIDPGPKVGMIMNALMEEVLDNPKKNTKEYLESRTKELSTMGDQRLADLAKQGKEKTKEMEDDEIDKIKEKHFVK